MCSGSARVEHDVRDVVEAHQALVILQEGLIRNGQSGAGRKGGGKAKWERTSWAITFRGACTTAKWESKDKGRSGRGAESESACTGMKCTRCKSTPAASARRKRTADTRSTRTAAAGGGNRAGDWRRRLTEQEHTAHTAHRQQARRRAGGWEEEEA